MIEKSAKKGSSVRPTKHTGKSESKCTTTKSLLSYGEFEVEIWNELVKSCEAENQQIRAPAATAAQCH